MNFRNFILSFLISLVSFSFTAFAGTPRYTFDRSENKSNSYDNVKPGDKLEGAVDVVLIDDVKASFELSFSSSSDNVIAQTGTNSILDMSTWIEFPNKSIFFIDGTPAGQQKVKVPFIIHIPDSISPGDYRGSMKLVYLLEGDINDFKAGQAGVNVTTAIGMSFNFSIPGTRFHKLEFLDMFVDRFELKNETTGKPQFMLSETIKSSGNSMLQALLDIKIKNMDGKIIYEKSENLGTVFAGIETSRNHLIDKLQKKPFPGWIDIEGKLSYQLVDVDGKAFGDNFEVGIAKIRVYSLPWVMILIITLLFSAVLLTVVQRRYTYKKLLSLSKVYIAKQGDTLQSVSEKFSVNPKDIIKVNKLKSPYFLSTGKEVFIPGNK